MQCIIEHVAFSLLHVLSFMKYQLSEPFGKIFEYKFSIYSHVYDMNALN